MDEQQQRNQPRRSVFDDFMFGPPLNQQGSGDAQQNQQPIQDNPSPPSPQQSTEEKSDNSEIDMAQMMQSIDTLMGYANKFGPTLKKLGPIFDLLNGSNSPKK